MLNPSMLLGGPGGVPPQPMPNMDSLMQAMAMDPAQAQAAAAMYWQMQMAAPYQNPAMMLPQGNPAMMLPPTPSLNVRVEGLKFEYQLTEDDVRKVFSRYGGVLAVTVDRDGTAASVQFETVQYAKAAQHDLDRKQLAGMQGAHLRVEFPPAAANMFDPAMQMAAATAAQSYAAQQPMTLNSVPYPPPPMSMQAATPSLAAANRPKKFTCKLEVGIENEPEFRVGSRVIQIAKQIWQEPTFQQHGGKTRLRGKGVGGPHEADEPLALCISCRDQMSFDRAMQYAEQQLQKVQGEYKTFCTQKGWSVPELSVKVSKKGSALPPYPRDGGSYSPGGDMPRGERPPNAPPDEEIEKLIEERNEARKAANFKRSDEIREHLRQLGVVLMDEKGAKGNLQGKEVTKWRFWRP